MLGLDLRYAEKVAGFRIQSVDSWAKEVRHIGVVAQGRKVRSERSTGCRFPPILRGSGVFDLDLNVKVEPSCVVLMVVAYASSSI